MARLLSLAAALALLVTLALAVPPIERDVCILGSGASGTYSLVQLSTRNYSVQLFETDDEVGGYCDTVYFNAPPGAPNWLELGVNTFENPNVTNSLGLTNYKVDFKGFVESLGVPTQSIDYIGSTTATTGNYAFWLAGRLNLQIPPQTPDQIQATFAALITLQTIIATYPWLDTPNWPNPLPAELLGNFLDYIKDPAHNLEILVPSLFGPLLYSGGLGDFSRLTTIYALRNLHKSILALFTVPNSGFVCIGGCKAYYNAARARYSDRIMLNAVITDVDRPRGCPPGVAVDDDDDCHDDDNRIRITVKSGSRGQRQQYRCGKLLVAFTPYLPDIQFLGPDSVERALWQDLKVRYYWGFQVNITGPISDNGAFQISIVDPTQPQNYALPSLPGITGISRFLPYGPAAGLAVSNEPLSDDAITAVIKQQLALFPPDQVTSAVFQKLEPHTRFQPHFSPSVLAQSPSPYARLASLQGYKNTFWLGQVASYSETLMVTEHANQIINQYFPAKPRPGRS